MSREEVLRTNPFMGGIRHLDKQPTPSACVTARLCDEILEMYSARSAAHMDSCLIEAGRVSRCPKGPMCVSQKA